LAVPPEDGTMSRPVPEAAPIVGLVLAFAFALFGFLFSADHLGTALVGVALLYPFVAFGVARSEDPTAVFRPDVVLAVGFLGGAPVLLYGVATGRPLFGAFVASVVAVPPALYHARFGESVNPLSASASLAVGLLVALGLLAYGAAGNLLLGALSAVVVGLGAVDYHRQRGGTLDRRARTVGVVGCLGGGLAAFGLLAVTDRPTAGLAAGAVLVAIGGALALEADLQ
jgi:hypothetical protein